MSIINNVGRGSQWSVPHFPTASISSLTCVAPPQQAGEFKTGEEDVIDSAEVRLRAAYKEASIAVMNAVVPDKGHPFVKVRGRGSECE